MKPLACIDIARAVLGEPAKCEGEELLYRCTHPERHKNADAHPSLKVNPKKDTWACFVCGQGGTAWQLAAFIAGVDPDDKSAVVASLKECGLLNSGGRGQAQSADAGRGPCVAKHVYRDEGGKAVARKLRYEPGANGKKKDFSWERWESGKWVSGLGDVKPPLYRLPEIRSSSCVVDTEGEKDADAGAQLGLPTTTSGGVGSWRPDHGDNLRGKSVVIVSDGDDAGRPYAQKKAASLHAQAVSVKVVEIPGSKDLAQAIERGMTVEQFWALTDSAPLWQPADGAALMAALLSFIKRFVSLTDAQAIAVALWVVHAHAIEAADFTPYLAINSPEKQSGKTRLLEVMKPLVRKAWMTGRVSAAALYRKIDAECPTLLLDESDAAFGRDKEYAEALRGILNSGYERDGTASCCIGQGANITYKDFCTFSPKAIAGLGKLPDTVADRSIPVRLKRARPGQVERFRKREVNRKGSERNALVTALRAKLVTWSDANLEKLSHARPEIPEALSDRQADACESLLAIADLAGADWPEAARQALVELCAKAHAEDGSIGVKLLSDIRSIFNPHDDNGQPLAELERIASSDLAKALAEMEDRPWAEWGKSQRSISQPQLARLLGQYEDDKHHPIAPRPLRLPDERRLRGYEREQFEESWALYLPPSSEASSLSTSDSKRDTVTTGENTRPNANSHPVTLGPCHASENAALASKNAPCHGVTDQNGAVGEDAADEQKIPEVEWEA